MPALRSPLVQFAVAACAAGALAACSAKYAQVPPRLDLAPHGPIALATFTTDRPDDGPAATAATARFAESVVTSQRVELLELGRADTTFRARADSAGAPAVFVGHLKLSRVTPRGSLGDGGVKVRGEVTAELSVRLVNVRTGGTLWRSSSAASGTVGRLGLTRAGLPSVAMRDREEAYGELVGELVAQVTRDLRATWVKQ